MKKKVIAFLLIILIVSVFCFVNQKDNILKILSKNTDKYVPAYTYNVDADNTTYTWIEGQGNGTIESPYTITSKDDFIKFIDLLKQSSSSANNLKGIYFELTNDLDFSGDEAIELPKHSNFFYGHFDGKGHVIKNLNGTYTGNTAASLFARVNGVIANFGLIGGKFTVKTETDMSAIIATRLENNGTLYNVYSTTDLEFTTTNAAKKPAGLVGFMVNGAIKNCYYDGKIITDEGAKTYGLTRFSTGAMLIQNSFVGNNSNTQINYGPEGTASNSNKYTNSPLEEKVDITSDSVIETMNVYQFTVNADYLWEVSQDETYLTLVNKKAVIGNLFEGEGTQDIPYYIQSNHDFLTFINLIKVTNENEFNLNDIYFELTTDLDFTDHEPITLANHSNYFFGHFDGKGHVVKNLNGYYKGTAAASLFSRVNGSVKNFGLVGGKFTIDTTADMSAIMASRVEKTGEIYNVFSTTDLDFITTNVDKKPAGIASFISTGKVINCYYGGKITAAEDAIKYGVGRSSSASGIVNSFTSYDSNIEISGGSDTIVFSKEKIDITTTSGQDRLNLYQYLNDGEYFWKYDDVNNKIVLTTEKMILDDFFSGDGSLETPYLISSNIDLKNLRTFIELGNKFEGKYFKQTKDLDFTNEDAINGLVYEKIFSGSYNGSGYYIKNLKINGTNGALFGGVVNGEIKNFGLIGGKITAKSGRYIGTIARRLENTDITNVYSTMDVEINSIVDNSVGGLFGGIENSSRINNVYYGGTYSYTEGSGAPFLSLFSLVNIEVTKKNTTLNNAYWPKGYNGYYDEGDEGPVNILSGDNVMALSRDEMTSDILLDKLNYYSLKNDIGYYWTFEDGIDYPVMTWVKPEAKEYVFMNTLTVDGYDNGNTVTTDKINWYKANNSEYYLFLPKYFDRNNLKVNYITTDENSSIEVYDINNNLLGTIEDNNYTDLFKNDKVILKVQSRGMIPSSYTLNIKQSNIPSLFIEIDGGDDSYNQIIDDPKHETAFPGNSVIFDKDNNDTMIPIKEIKGRGNKTWTLPKRPYQIKYNEKVSMLGMKSAKTWLLLAGYTDGSLSRNAISQMLAKDLGIDYTIEFEPAEVYINNKYMGSFLVTSKVEVDKNRVNLNDGLGENNDFLLEIDNNTDSFQFYSSKKYLLTVKSPKLESLEALEATAKMNAIKKVINDFESLLYKEDVTYEELDSIIDMDSFAKFYWIEEYFENFDFMVGSCYLYYQDGKIHMGPIWDMDNTLNRSYFVANTDEYYSLSNTSLASRRRADWYGQLFKISEFSDLVDKYFIDNKNLFEKLPNELDNYTSKLNSSFDMNYIRWPYNEMKIIQGNWTAGENNYQTAITNYRNNLISRFNFYSNEYRGLELSKISYTYTLQDETVKTEEKIVDNNNINIVLPLDIDLEKEIILTYTTKDGLESDGIKLGKSSDASSITLTDMIYSDKINLYNNIEGNLAKTVNANTYNLSMSVLPVSIEITTAPEKTKYYEGNKFDPTGMVVMATYDDGSVKEITTYNYKTDALTTDDTSLIIEYCGIETVLDNITVIGRKKLEITTAPDKLEYIEGDKFSTNGMVINLIYNDDTKEEITNYTYPTGKLTLDNTTILIEYEGLSVSQEIVIKENIITELKITTNPTKMSYEVGEVFDPTDMVITAVHLNGKETKVTEYTYKEEPLTLDDTNFEITYNDIKVNLTLEIEEKVIEYIINIPDTIDLDSNNNSKFEISVDKITDNINLDITINSQNTFNLKYKNNSLKYKVFGDDETNVFNNNDIICRFNKDLMKKEFNLKLDDDIKYAGNYTDTLTFTVDIK